MKDLDLKTAIALVRDAIAEKGEDYVYQKVNNTCVYSVNGEPSCLVGEVLIRHGVEANWFDETSSNSEPAEDVARMAGADYDFEAPFSTRAFLSNIQASQDEGISWGDALRMALKGQYGYAVGSGGHEVIEGYGGAIDESRL